MGIAKTALTGFVAMQVCLSGASAEEICHFAGTTDFAGRVSVTTEAATANDTTHLDITARFDGRWLVLFHVHYLTQEISTWRAGQLESVAVNNRYLIGQHVIRQQWDVFQRAPGGFQAHRIEGKSFADFRRKFPRFAQHWDPATFGEPWLQDFASASPERRADLDLKLSARAPELRTPLAMAFYWDRWLPHGGEDIPVFLPGFKHDRLVNLPIETPSSSNPTRWQASVLYPALSKTRPSTATAWISPDRHVVQLTLDLHRSGDSAEGVIHQEGCQGAPVPPIGR